MASQIVKQLTQISEAKGKVNRDNGDITGILTLKTVDGEDVEMTVDEFDAIYRGMVKCWPVVKPLKEEVRLAKFEALKDQRAAEKEEKEKQKAKERKEREDAKAKAAKEKAKKANAKAKGKGKKAKATAKKEDPAPAESATS